MGSSACRQQMYVWLIIDDGEPGGAATLLARDDADDATEGRFLPSGDDGGEPGSGDEDSLRPNMAFFSTGDPGAALGRGQGMARYPPVQVCFDL